MQSDCLHKYYNFQTNQRSTEVIIDKVLIERLKNKIIKDKKEVLLAWKLIKFIKKLPIDFNSSYNFNFYMLDGQIKIALGRECAHIKNNLPEYENYLECLEQEGIESYIEFEAEENFEESPNSER